MKAHLTDASMYQKYLRDVKMLSESSVNRYMGAIIRFLKTDPDVDSLESYNNFIIAYAIKKRCYNYYAALKSFVEYKFTDANSRNKLLEGLIHPPIRSDIVMERKHLDDELTLDVINSFDKEKHKVVALIQSLTGVRAGDIMKLKRDNIVPEEYKGKPTLRLNITGKGKKRNVIYIHDEIAQAIILDYITTVYNVNDYYFLELGKMNGREGDVNDEEALYRMNYQWYYIDLKTALQVNHVDLKDFATHDFRRGFARKCWTKWKDITVLQKMLNHRDAATSMRYLQQSGLQNIDHHYAMQMGEERSNDLK